MRMKFFILIIFITLFFSISSSIITSQTSTPPLSIDKDVYETEETVVININIDPGEYTLYELLISATNNSYTYSGDFNPVMFFYPIEEGIYTTALVEKSTRAIFYSLTFNVSAKESNISVTENESAQEPEPVPSPPEPVVINGSVSTDKKEYLIGENVLVFVNVSNGDKFNLYHSFKGISKKYMGDLRYINFIPERIGTHELILMDSGGGVLEVYSFKVNPPLGKRILKIINSKGFEEEVDIKVYDEEDQLIEDAQSTSVLINRNFSLEIIPTKKIIKKIKLSNLEFTGNLSMGVEEVGKGKINIKQRSIVKAFALDSSGLNFTNGTVTGIASGSELWKCKDWDFVNQQCLGTWQKIMDLTPGQEYEIEISPEDPGYAETGVASINTKKPIYHLNEKAEIIIVVLDIYGHLVSNANVILDITNPNNQITTLTTIGEEIIETDKGIYETKYNNTNLEGNYTLFIRATGNNVNSTMYSYFTVKSYYEFDILRNTPVVTDPWRGVFDSSIRIISYTTSVNFNFTEVLPQSFTITNPGGAVRTINNNKTYLTWTNLNNNSVISYSARPPLVSPELYGLGPSFITYNLGPSIFYEARPWYLAVDPITYYDPNSSTQEGWDLGTSTNYTAIDEGERYPTTTGMTADYIQARANDNTYSEHGFPNITQPLFNITLWIYTNTTNCGYLAYLQQNGTTRCTLDVNPNTALGWYNCSWTTPSGNYDNMTVEFYQDSKDTGGPGMCYVYEAYLEVNYNYPPNITYIIIDDSVGIPLDQIDLTAGSTRAVYCNITIEDLDNYTDIQGLNATFYSTTTTYDAADSNRTHYSNISCSLISGLGQNADYQCIFNVWNYAINGSWNCTAFAWDPYVTVNNTDNTTMSQLFALNVSTLVIDYTDLEPNQASPNVTVNISNVGNMPMNISVYGFGGNDSVIGDGLSMICEINNISVQFERFSINSSDDYNSKTQLSSTEQDLGLTIQSKINPSDIRTNSSYWQFMVPPSSYAFGECNGTVVFVANAP